MLTLTCSVSGKYRNNGGRRYVLEPVASHVIVPGVADPSGVDIGRTHVAVYDRKAGEALLRLNDLHPDKYESGGCMIVLGTLGWLHLNVLLGAEDADSIIPDLNTSLCQSDLMVAISIDGVFAPSERVALEQWLAGERYREDLKLHTESFPSFALVRRK